MFINDLYQHEIHVHISRQNLISVHIINVRYNLNKY